MTKGNLLPSFLEITVPYYMPIAILGIFVGVTTGGGSLDYNVFLSFISVVALVAAFNTFNGVTDFKIDLINKPHRPIPSGKISRNSALMYSEIFYFISMWVAYQLTAQFFQIMVLSSVITVLYSFPAIRLRKRFIISNLCGAILYGLLCPMAGWALVPANPLPIYILGFTFLFSLSLSMSKDFEDFIGDRVYGMRTMPVALGIEKAKLISTLILSLSFVYLTAIILLGFIEVQYILVILTLPAFILLIRRMYKNNKSFYNSIEDRKIAKKIFFMLMGLAILVEFLIGIIALL